MNTPTDRFLAIAGNPDGKLALPDDVEATAGILKAQLRAVEYHAQEMNARAPTEGPAELLCQTIIALAAQAHLEIEALEQRAATTRSGD
jgi:hypothetical protein